MADSSHELLARWRDLGDQEAATDLFNRYVARLVALARTKLARPLAARVDADDIVQSACRSFFIRVRDGRLLLQPGAGLWELLAAITLRKVFGKAAFHGARKRAIGREERTEGDDVCRVEAEAVARGPSPEEEALVAEELEEALAGLQPLHRRIVQMRLEGHATPEIAAEVRRSERLVRLVLSGFGVKLKSRLSAT